MPRLNFAVQGEKCSASKKILIVQRAAILSLSVSLLSWGASAEEFSISGSSVSQNGGFTLSAGDSLTLETGATLSVSGQDAIVDDASEMTINVKGDVTSDSDEGIDLDGYGHVVNIYGTGSVSGDGDGIWLDAQSVLTIYAGGTVEGGSDGIDLDGDGNSVVVHGAVIGGDDGIYLDDTADGNAVRIYGSVIGRDEGIDVDGGSGNIVSIYSGASVASVGTGNDDGIWIAGGNTVNVYFGAEVSSVDSDGIELDGDASSVNIFGTVRGDDNSIYVDDGTNNIVHLGKGARLIGGITTDTSGNTLSLDVGSAMSYVYDTNGPWIFDDLDNRAYVTTDVSAVAVGIGNAETADELMFGRERNFSSAVFRVAPTGMGHWIAPFYSQTNRDADASNPTIERFNLREAGFVGGLQLSEALGHQVVFGYQRSDLDIDHDTQKIGVDSFKAGLLLEHFKNAIPELEIQSLYGLGSNRYSSERKVLINSNTITGQTIYDSSFAGYEASIGLQAKYSSLIAGSDVTRGFIHGGLSLTHERLAGYVEDAHFEWENRNMTLAIADISAGLVRSHDNGLQSSAKVSMAYRDLVGGKETAYSIDGNREVFENGAFHETSASIDFGASYTFDNGGTFGGIVSGQWMSNNSRTFSGSLTVKLPF